MKKVCVFLGILIPFLLSAQIDLETGLVAYFPFNGNAIDQTGHGNDATVHGAALTSDRFGHADAAYLFNGADNLMTIEDNPQLRLSSVSLLLWVTFWDLPTNQRNFISKPVGYLWSDSYVFWYHDDGISGHIGNVNGAGAVTHYTWVPELETWYFLAYTYDELSKTQTLFLNGQQVASGYTDPEVGWDEHPVMIGAESDVEDSVYWHHGGMDDILIYDRALNSSEIMALYNSYYAIDEMVHSKEMIVEIIPNPASNLALIRFNIENACRLNCELYTLQGKMVTAFSEAINLPGWHEMELDVSNLPTGVYILRIDEEENSVERKLMVRR
jgi:hypothetical protein